MTDPHTTVTELLARLGDTPDAIADQLRARGIKGTRGSDCTCPIAEYLKRGAGLTNISVGCWIFADEIDGDDLLTSDAVCDFIDRFDKGVYLDLVEVPDA